MVGQKMILLKPMQPGVSGYARLECEQGRTWLQVNARGLKGKAVRFFWYGGDGETKELGASPVNSRGEASLNGAAPWNRLAPERLQALLLLEGEGEPKPLLIGLCAAQSAGSLLDAKNASLSLCEKLKRSREKAEEKESKKEAEKLLPPPKPAARRQEPPARGAPKDDGPPREIFLPAIDPAPYVPAGERPAAAPPPPRESPAEEAPPARERGAPVDELEGLVWPAAFQSLREHFSRNVPSRPVDMPGWRFVRVAAEGDGLWIGYRQWDGRVRKVAYAMRGRPEKDDARPYQIRQGLDGKEYRLLLQRA